MLATAGTDRSAMRVKSGSVALAAAPAGAVTGRAGAPFCALCPSPPLSARPVMTRPATKPSPASSSAIRVNRRTDASGSDGDSTSRGDSEFGDAHREDAVLQIGRHRGGVDRERQLKRPLEGPVPAFEAVELL